MVASRTGLRICLGAYASVCAHLKEKDTIKRTFVNACQWPDSATGEFHSYLSHELAVSAKRSKKDRDSAVATHCLDILTRDDLEVQSSATRDAEAATVVRTVLGHIVERAFNLFWSGKFERELSAERPQLVRALTRANTGISLPASEDDLDSSDESDGTDELGSDSEGDALSNAGAAPISPVN
jgi:hypothetical protein